MNKQRPGSSLVHLDGDALMQAIDKRLKTEGRSLRSLGRELGIWPSLFSRLRQGMEISSNALITILMWLDRPVSDFAKVVGEERASVLTLKTNPMIEAIREAIAHTISDEYDEQFVAVMAATACLESLAKERPTELAMRESI